VGLRLGVRAFLQTQPSHPAVEICTVGLKNSGSFRHVPFCLSQGGSDETTFEIVQCFAERPSLQIHQGSDGVPGRRASKHLPYRGCIDHRSAENAETLYQIGQLPDISRPGVGGQRIKRGRRSRSGGR
jgi:hypothetical protein